MNIRKLNYRRLLVLTIFWLVLIFAGFGLPLFAQQRIPLSTSGGFGRVIFSPDGNTLASTRSNIIKFHDPKTGRLLAMLKEDSGSDVSRIIFSPDGKTLASYAYAYRIKLWDLATRQVRIRAGGHVMAFSPDGKTLAIGGALYDVPTGRLRIRLELGKNAGRIAGVAFSPDSKTLASTCLRTYHATGILGHTVSKNSIELYDVETGRLRATLKAEYMGRCLAFSPDGKILASSADGAIKVWDPKTGSVKLGQRRPRPNERHKNVIVHLLFSPDGKTIASSAWASSYSWTDRSIKLWDPNTAKLRASLEGHTDFITSLAFSPDGQILASASKDKTIKLWDVAKAQLLATLNRQVHSVAFSPDGKILASGGGWAIKLWDMDTVRNSDKGQRAP